MNSAFGSLPLPTRSSVARRYASVGLFLAVTALSSTLFAQVDPNAPEGGGRNRRGQNGQNAGGAGGPGGNRGNFNQEEMQQRMATMLREQFEVTDEAEWKLISERIAAVTELRLGAGGFGGGRGGAGGGRGGRGNGNVELTALRQAITDKLPEAEIKSRLERLRETRKASEEKLIKAQEDLRAVLSVRQEAVAVMQGLLP